MDSSLIYNSTSNSNRYHLVAAFSLLAHRIVRIATQSAAPLLQEDFAVMLSAPSAPSLPSSRIASQTIGNDSFAGSMNAKQLMFLGGNIREGLPPLPDQAAQKSLVFSSLAVGKKISLTGPASDRNAIV